MDISTLKKSFILMGMLISFLNDADIQLILEFKNSFGKYHPKNMF